MTRDAFGEVYPAPPTPLTADRLKKYPFFLKTRREFFSKSWQEGFFRPGSVTMLLAPRMFGKTSFINMLPFFLKKKNDCRTVYTFFCNLSYDLDIAQSMVDTMLRREGKDSIMVLDEMNYIVGKKALWSRLVELSDKMSQMKSLGQAVVLTTSEPTSREAKRIFDALHPSILRFPALNQSEVKTIVDGVVRKVRGVPRVKRKVSHLIWRVSGGIPPYVRLSLMRLLQKRRLDRVPDVDFSLECMSLIFDSLEAVSSCIRTLTKCPVETSRMKDEELSLGSDQFCRFCSIGCRTPSVSEPVLTVDLADSYGLVFAGNALSPPIAYYYNDYLARKQFEQIAREIANQKDRVRRFATTYGRREFVVGALILLEIAHNDPSLLAEKLEASSVASFVRDRPQLTFLRSFPSLDTISNFVDDFNKVCEHSVYGDSGIDLEVKGLRICGDVPAVNAYVQCKNWKRKVGLREVGIFHKFEMVLREARQIHAAILVSTSGINNKMKQEAKKLTSRTQSVFCCWDEDATAAFVSSVCDVKTAEVLRSISNLSKANIPTKPKGGALEFVTLKVFSALGRAVLR